LGLFLLSGNEESIIASKVIPVKELLADLRREFREARRSQITGDGVKNNAPA